LENHEVRPKFDPLDISSEDVKLYFSYLGDDADHVFRKAYLQYAKEQILLEVDQAKRDELYQTYLEIGGQGFEFPVETKEEPVMTQGNNLLLAMLLFLDSDSDEDA